MALKTFIQDPDEYLDYDVDWSAVLKTDEGIASSVWSKTGTCTIDNQALSGALAKIYVGAIALGADGACVITNLITTDSTPARKHERSFLVRGTSSAA